MAILLATHVAPMAVAQHKDDSAKGDTNAAAAAAPSQQWLLLCDNAGAQLDCRVRQTLVLQKTGRRLLTVVVRRPSKSEPPALMLTLPHGLYLPAGATLQIGAGKPDNLVIQTCDDKGCYAGAPLPPPVLQTMQKSETLTVTFQDLSKKTISVPVPLAGFAAAYQKMP